MLFLTYVCIGNHMGLSEIWKIHSNPCGYLLIIWHHALIAKDFCITKHACGEAVLFLPACYLEKEKSTLPQSDFYTVYEIAV